MQARVVLTESELSNPVLTACSQESREKLAEAGIIRHVEAAEVLYAVGAPAGVVLFPLSGNFQFSMSAERGRRQVLCNLNCVSCRGLCLLTMAERSLADVIAMTAGDVLIVDRPVFQALARADPVLCQTGWQAAVECISHFSSLVERLSFHKVAERVAELLLEHSTADGEIVRLTQAGLAAEVGTTREVVARCLANLQSAGAVQLGRARITVVSRAKLAQETA
jgi:CRP/FNR family transcriptional regulator